MSPVLVGSLLAILSSGVAASGALCARWSKKGATVLSGVLLALILLKAVAGRYPAVEPRLFPWLWYPWVENWWYLTAGLFLLGAGLYLVRKSRWKRSAVMVASGLVLLRTVAVGWDSMRSHDGLRGEADANGVCRQTSGYSCAAAAAAALLHHHGVAATEREMAVLSVTRPRVGGATEAGIIRGLRLKLGDGWHVRIAAPGYDELPAPCLVSVRLGPTLGHCVLLEAVKPDAVVLMDPLAGRITESRESFEARWQGTAIYIPRLGNPAKR